MVVHIICSCGLKWTSNNNTEGDAFDCALEHSMEYSDLQDLHKIKVYLINNSFELIKLLMIQSMTPKLSYEQLLDKIKLSLI